MRRYLFRCFAIDFRSLALFRICLGLIVCVDLMLRLADLRAHYGFDGVLPLELLQTLNSTSSLSVWNFARGQNILLPFLWAHFSLNLFCGLALVLGFYTRVATILCWLLLISLHNRNYLVLDSGDDYLRILLFWSMFLPLGRKWSLDAARSDNAQGAAVPLYFSPSTAGIILQIVYIYAVSGFLKQGSSWVSDGNALQIVLYYDIFATPLAQWLRRFPEITSLMTYWVVCLERWGCMLWFMPVGFVLFRYLGIVFFALFHVGIIIFMSIGVFPWICLIALTLLVPKEFWDHLKFRSFELRSERWNFLKGATDSMNFFLKRFEVVFPANNYLRSFYSFIQYFFLVIILFWNLHVIASAKFQVDKKSLWSKLPPFVEISLKTFRLDQRWGMFAPEPARDDGWYLVSGITSDGKEVDLYLLAERQPTMEKPELVSSYYENGRWRKYLSNIRQPNHRVHVSYYARYLCRRWMEHYPELKITHVKVRFMSEQSSDYGESPPIAMDLYSGQCKH